MAKTRQINKYAVPADKLRWTCPKEVLSFGCTSEIEPLKDFMGQKRALDSIDFGLAVERPGYNLFLTGLVGTGKAATIKACLEKFIADNMARGIKYEPGDWCYVYNFTDPDQPRILKLLQGQGKALSAQMEALLKTLKEEIPKAFESENYTKQKQDIMEGHQRKYQEIVTALEKEASERKLAVQLSPAGTAVAPTVEGRIMSRDEFMALSDEEKEAIESRRLEFMRKIDGIFAHIHELEMETGEKIEALNLKTGEFAISRPFQKLLEAYGDNEEVLNFLKEVRDFTLTGLDLFNAGNSRAAAPLGSHADPFIAYKINVFVDNSAQSGPPIIIESNPNWFNMFGKVERRALMGAYLSDHTMIKAGAVQMANGGYLILNIRDILLNAGVWEGLKRVIRTKEVRVEDPWEQFGFLAPQGMKPQTMPLDFKIVVMGEDSVYQLLSIYDEDFWELFKVKADFDYQIERTDENIKCYARFIRTCCDEEKLRPFDNTGVAKMLEYAARVTGDQGKLTARLGQVRDMLIEADYWARDAKSDIIGEEHVLKALRAKTHRLDLVAERIRRMTAEGVLMVDVEGAVVGQVNGLAVNNLGTFSFGHPSRITARTFLGKGGVINIERESRMSGSIHDKGVLILSGYLGWKYAQDKPLSLSASICFEQSYSGVEGDSASSTELYAILSCLAELPIRQDIAVTGSVNQKGEIQPIGGVNHKIEGFFDVCRIMGFTGRQGVMIPRQNIRNLMLREDIVKEVRDGRFHIYAVSTIDEGIEILTGVPAGKRKADGTYPAGSVNCLVDKKVRQYAEIMMEHMMPAEQPRKKGKKPKGKK